VKIPERKANESLFRFSKSFPQKRETQSVRIGQQKIPQMRNSGVFITQRNLEL
jgi:hypothetical protein